MSFTDRIRDFFEHWWHSAFNRGHQFSNWCRKVCGLPRKPVHYHMRGRGVVIGIKPTDV